jgi:hypothetical protein
MIGRWLVVLGVVFGSAGVSAQSGSSPQEMLARLKTASKMDGVQVGMIVDAHSSAAEVPYTEIVTLPAGAHTAYEVLQKSKVTKVYHPQYKEPPMVMVLSLMGQAPDRTARDGRRSWAFFVGTAGNTKWTLSNKGIAEAPVSDGSLIGFSRTAWVQEGGVYGAKEEPRL